MKTYRNFYLKTLFLVVKFSIYLNRRIFIMFCSVRVMLCSIISCNSNLIRSLRRAVFRDCGLSSVV